jgi:hypothetical protein
MALNLYQSPTIGPIQNIQLKYNFDNVSINSPIQSTLLTNEPLKNIKSIFTSYNTDYSTTALYSSFNINSSISEQQISYSDNITNSPIKYTIQYLHVGISPIQMSETNAFALILDCIDSNKNILLIIIPIKVDTTITEIEDVTTLIKRINGSDGAFSINNFIPRSSFITYNDNVNRVIIFNNSNILIKTPPTFMTTITTAIKGGTLTPSPAFSLPSSYKSLTIPEKTTILAQNDIYIDCYKVGESDKIDGGINTDPQTMNKNKLKSLKEQKRDSTTALYIFMGIFGVAIFFIIFYYSFKYVIPKEALPQVTIKAEPSSSFMSGMGPILIIMGLIFTIFMVIRET